MKKILSLLLFLFVITMTLGFVSAATPNGAAVTAVSTSTAGLDNPTTNNAIAGNITELAITGYSSTQAWQGYYGNVSGTIQLADANKKAMYNWSHLSAKGQVYSSESNAVTWTTIDCLNITADGATLEAANGIGSTDADGVDETFNLANHAAFSVGAKSFGVGQCNNTKLYGATGTGTFDEALLTDGTNTVFASLLKDNTNGFDGGKHDFEMLVLEDGHSGDTTATPYYFYLELV